MQKIGLAVLAVVAGLGAARADEVVKLAYIDPLSGSLAATGQLGEQHFRFAIDRVNARQAAGPGRRLELVPLDNEVSPDKSLTLLRKAIDDGVHYIAQGNGSSVAFALSDAIAKNNRRAPNQAVMFLNYAAVDPGLTNEKCTWWHFRFDADVDMKMRALTDYLVSQPAVKKVYVFNPDYSFGVSVEKAAQAMLANRRPDLQIVGAERVPLGKIKDFTPYIQKMQAAGADAVVTGNWGADLALLAKAAGDSGFKGTFFTYYLGSSDVIAGVGNGGRDVGSGDEAGRQQRPGQGRRRAGDHEVEGPTRRGDDAGGQSPAPPADVRLGPGAGNEVHLPGSRARLQDREPDRGRGSAPADNLQVRWPLVVSWSSSSSSC